MVYADASPATVIFPDSGMHIDSHPESDAQPTDQVTVLLPDWFEGEAAAIEFDDVFDSTKDINF